VEIGGADVQVGHLGVGHLDALLISGWVKTTLDRQAVDFGGAIYSGSGPNQASAA
jgi:hypothetical protein